MKAVLRSSVLVTIFLFLLVYGANAQVIGSLTHVEGRVDILHSGEAMFNPASEGDSVFLKDVVRTRANGKAKIELTNGNALSLAPFTRIDMEEYLAVKERTGTIKLSRGKVRVTIPKKFRIIPVIFRREPAFEAQTPTAVVGIRGSDAFIFHQRGVTGAIFMEGTGYAYNTGFPDVVQKIGGGEAVFISADTPAPPPRPASKSEMAIHAREMEPAEEGVTEEEPSSKGESAGDEGTPTEQMAAEVTEMAAAETAEMTVESPETALVEASSSIQGGLETNILIPITEIEKEKTIGTEEAIAEASGEIHGAGRIRGTLDSGAFWYYSGGSMNSQGSMSGSFVGTEGSWIDDWPSVNFTGNTSDPAQLWLTGMEGTATGSSGNFEGYMGGIKLGSSMKGWVLDIYIDPDQNAGYLIGDLSGSFGSFSATGDLKPIQMSSGIGISPENLSSSLSVESSFSNVVSYSGGNYFSGSFSAGGSLKVYAASGKHFDISDKGWGAWVLRYGGEFSGTTSDPWQVYFREISTENASLWDSKGRVYLDLVGSRWSGNELAAIARGYQLDTDKPGCGIMYGKSLGTYSVSSATTFEALTYGYGIKAETYWDMLQSDKATLTKLNIPVTEVYSSTLNSINASQSSVFFSTANMNMKFLGASSGASHGLWSALLSGTYGAGAVNNWTLYIENASSGDWANIEGMKWSAGRFLGEVTGGELNGNAIQIKGAVNGSYTGTTSGTFSGHGAGVW